MRVLLVSDMYARPDRLISATFFHRQMLEVTGLGVEVRVLSPLPAVPGLSFLRRSPHATIEESALDGIPVRRVRFPKPLPFGPAARLGGYLLQRTLRRHVKDIFEAFPFDLIYGIRLFPIVSSLLPIASELDRPLVGLAMGADVHTHPYRSRGIRMLTRRAIEQSDRVASVSRALAREMLDLGTPRLPVRTVYNGVDTELFRPTTVDKASLRRDLGLPSSGIGVCTVCRVEREKGLRELVAAFQQTLEAEPEAWLAIVGDGAYRWRLERLVERRGLASRVLLPGARGHEEMPRWLNAADVFALPSYNEGLPNAVMEAMACGLAVVSTHVGGTGEAVIEGETGFLVPPAQVEPLSQRLGALMRSPELRDRMGRAGRQRAVDVFGWRQSAEALVALCEDTLEARRS